MSAPAWFQIGMLVIICIIFAVVLAVVISEVVRYRKEYLSRAQYAK